MSPKLQSLYCDFWELLDSFLYLLYVVKVHCQRINGRHCLPELGRRLPDHPPAWVRTNALEGFLCNFDPYVVLANSSHMKFIIVCFCIAPCTFARRWACLTLSRTRSWSSHEASGSRYAGTHCEYPLRRSRVAPSPHTSLNVCFKIGVDGPSRGYILEIYQSHFQLPQLGPIGGYQRILEPHHH